MKRVLNEREMSVEEGRMTVHDRVNWRAVM